MIHSEALALGDQVAPQHSRTIREAIALANSDPQRALRIIRRVRDLSPIGWKYFVDSYEGVLTSKLLGSAFG